MGNVQWKQSWALTTVLVRPWVRVLANLVLVLTLGRALPLTPRLVL